MDRVALENPALNLGVRRARTPEQGRQRCGAGSEKKHVTTFVRRPSHQTPVILKPDGAAEGTTDQISRGKSVLRDIVWKEKIGGRHCLAVVASLLFETIMAALRPNFGH